MATISDRELVAICEAHIQAASGSEGSELSDARSEAMDRYLGEPYGDEVEGRSQVRTREVMETVEWLMPSLMRIYADAENLCVFEPRGPEDEAQAQQETDLVSYAFWQQNRGFYNLYTFCKDALLSKTGVLKVWWDEDHAEEREEYSGLDDVQLAQLVMDETCEREILSFEQEADGYEVTFKTVRRRGHVRIEPVAPENFGVSRDARSPFAKDAPFVWQRELKSYNELRAAGYAVDVLETIPADEGIENAEEIARRNLSDEQMGGMTESVLSMRQFWIAECYLHIDRDGDGMAELVRVTLATGRNRPASGSTLLDVENVDSIPFATASPILLTHKFYGLSLADMVEDLQRIKTTLLRQSLDSLYIANNGRTVYNDDKVNGDDLSVARPGQQIRYTGEQPWNAYIGVLPHSPLPPETFALLEYLDEQRKQRTGIGDEVAALDKASLANVNTGVAALAYDAARSKLELIARIIAEIGLKTLLQDVHELLMKHQDKPMVVRLRGQWVQVNPSEWKSRENMTVTVGVGNASRERRLMALSALLQEQMATAQVNPMLVSPDNLYRARVEYTKAAGLDPAMYWTDPRTVPPPQGPSLQEQLAMTQMQALLMDAQAKMQRNEVEMFKAQQAAQVAQVDAQARMAEAQARQQVDVLKARQVALQSEIDTAGKVQDMRVMLEKQAVDSRLKELQLALDSMNQARDRDVDVYKIQTDAVLKLLQMNGIAADPEAQAQKDQQAAAEREGAQAFMAMMAQSVATLTAQLQGVGGALEELKASKAAPLTIERDADGLMLSVGGRPVQRDASGRVMRIG